MCSQEKVNFSSTEDEKLIEAVAKHPSLFDLHCSLYKDQVVKDNAWKEVAESVGRSDRDCRKRWKNIKDTYDRRKKRGKTTGTQVTVKNRKQWALADMLYFLETADHQRPSISNIEQKCTNLGIVGERDMDDSDVDDKDPDGDVTAVDDGPVEAEILQEDGSQLLDAQTTVKRPSATSQTESVSIIRKSNKRRRIPERMTEI